MASSKLSSAEILSVKDIHSLIMDSLGNSKAEDIKSIDISDKSSIGDYMIIASGRSYRHVGAIADILLRDLKVVNVRTPHVEGRGSSDWALIDIGDIIVHLFRPEVREFYNLEKMWLLPALPETDVS